MRLTIPFAEPAYQRARALLLALCCAGAATNAWGATTLFIKASANTDLVVAPFEQRFLNGAGEQSDHLSKLAGDMLSPNAYAIARVSGAVNEGSLAVNTYSRVEGMFNGSLVPYTAVAGSAEGTVSFKLTDVIFSGPGSTVSAALRLELSGLLGASAESRLNGTISDGVGTVTVSLRVNNGPQQLGTRTYASHDDSINPGTNGVVVDNGPLAGENLPATIEFNPVQVLTNVPVTVEVLLYAFGAASLHYPLGIGDGRSVGRSEFGTTAKLLSTGVFALPAGFTANSVSGNISNNAWLGTAVAAAPVPIPPAGLLLGVALGGLIGVRRGASLRPLRSK